jgi:hypothetical protein
VALAGWRARSFFGVHYDLHARADDTVLGTGLTHEHLRAELERLRPDWVQCDAKGHPGWTSWPTKVGSPSPGIVKDALRIHRDVTEELGLPLAIHYSGLWDTRAIELHPDWAMEHADGTRDKDKTCLLGPYRDELMIPQLLELVADYGVDGIWVDGENWAAAPCFCTRCRAAFGKDVPLDAEQPGWHEWLAFQRDLFVAHVSAYTDAVHKADPDCHVASNWVGSTIQPEPVVPRVDWLSGDSAPTVPTVLNARSMDGRGLPWELMTWSFVTAWPGHWLQDLKSPAHLRRETAISMACGGGVCLYDLPERDGHLDSWRQQELADLGAWARLRREVVAGTTSVPQVAVLQSERHHYLGSPPLFQLGEGDAPLRGAVWALLDAGYAVDLVNEADLVDRAEAFGLVVVPEQEDMSAAAAATLTRYVAQGGRLLLTGARVGSVLPDLVGAAPAGDVVDGSSMLPCGDRSFRVGGAWQPVTVSSAQPVAHLLRSFEVDDPTDALVVTSNDVGAGRVIAVHGPLFAHHAQFYPPLGRELVAALCRRLEPALDVAVHGPPPGRVHVTLREKDGATIVHLVNMGGTHPLSPVTQNIEDVPPSGPVTVRLRRAGAPAAVRLVPGGPLDHAYDGEWLSVTVPEVGIHCAVVVSGP